jgi:hypothetical protein
MISLDHLILALDMRAPTGTKIISPAKGKIVLIGNFFYAGNYIIY